jgi:hypothetical protein
MLRRECSFLRLTLVSCLYSDLPAIILGRGDRRGDGREKKRERREVKEKEEASVRDYKEETFAYGIKL